jgi:hypothetical protein
VGIAAGNHQHGHGARGQAGQANTHSPRAIALTFEWGEAGTG